MTELSLDQARMNAVIAQRNNALNAAAELEATIVLVVQERDSARNEVARLTTILSELQPADGDDDGSAQPA